MDDKKKTTTSKITYTIGIILLVLFGIGLINDAFDSNNNTTHLFNYSGGIVGAIMGTIAYLFFRLFTKSNTTIVILTAVSVITIINISNTYFLPYYNSWQAESILRQQLPILDLISKNYPEEYKTYIQKVKTNIQNRGNSNNIFYYTGDLVNGIFLKSVPRANNISLFNYLVDEVSIDKKLMKINPSLVLLMEVSEKSNNTIDPTILEQNVSKDDGDRILNDKQSVIKESLENFNSPNLTIDEKKAADILFESILNDLITKYGKENVVKAMQNAWNPALDKTIAASIYIELYEQIISKGAENAGLILKYMMAQ